MTKLHESLRLTDAERTEYLNEVYEAVGKISGSALLAGERCSKGDKHAIYEISCAAFSLLHCLKIDANIASASIPMKSGQGPVGNLRMGAMQVFNTTKAAGDLDADVWHPLYTSTPQRQPLTDAEIARIYLVNTDAPLVPRWNFARAIEAKRGIGDKT